MGLNETVEARTRIVVMSDVSPGQRERSEAIAVRGGHRDGFASIATTETGVGPAGHDVRTRTTE